MDNDDPNIFLFHLRQAVPLIIEGADLRMGRRYDAEYFASSLAGRPVITIDCRSGDTREELAEDFFKAFGSPHRHELRKVKVCPWLVRIWILYSTVAQDFPPENAFTEVLTDLQEDLHQVWPAANWTRPNGAHNIAAHFPTNSDGQKPDLGRCACSAMIAVMI